MPRQSMRERRKRHLKSTQAEFDLLQGLFKKLKFRLIRGDYEGILSMEESKKIRRLLNDSIISLPHGYHAVVTNLKPLQKRRTTYYQICRLLRKAGNRLQAAKASDSKTVILRKAETE